MSRNRSSRPSGQGPSGAELVHELRQPLFASKSLVQLLDHELRAEAPDLERARERVAVIEAQLLHMEAVIQRQALSGGGAGLGEGDTLLAMPVTAAVQTLEARAGQRGVVVDLELRPEPRRVRGDPTSVQQVVTNLLLNAIEAARQRVRVRVDGLQVSVEDDGPPPAPGQLERAFQAHVTTKATGQGLGLSLSLRLAEAMGARLRLERVGDRTLAWAEFAPPPTQEDDHGA